MVGKAFAALAAVALIAVGGAAVYEQATRAEPVVVKPAEAVELPLLKAPQAKAVTPAPKAEAKPAQVAVVAPKPDIPTPQGPPVTINTVAGSGDGGGQEQKAASADQEGAKAAKANKPRKAVVKRVASKKAGPKETSPPIKPEGTLLTVRLGSIPPNGRLFLDGKEVGVGTVSVPLLEGTQHVLRCVPNRVYCPDCPDEQVRPFKVAMTKQGHVRPAKCDFRKWTKAALPRG